MIYKAIKYILTNDSAFNTAIGGKIYPIHPRKEISLPICVFSILDQRGNPTKDATSGVDEIRVRITVYDDDLDSLVDLSEKCRAAMDGEQDGGTYNTEVVARIDFDNLNDVFVEDYGPNGAIGIDHNYIIWAEP